MGSFRRPRQALLVGSAAAKPEFACERQSLHTVTTVEAAIMLLVTQRDRNTIVDPMFSREIGLAANLLMYLARVAMVARNP